MTTSRVAIGMDVEMLEATDVLDIGDRCKVAGGPLVDHVDYEQRWILSCRKIRDGEDYTVQELIPEAMFKVLGDAAKPEPPGTVRDNPRREAPDVEKLLRGAGAPDPFTALVPLFVDVIGQLKRSQREKDALLRREIELKELKVLLDARQHIVDGNMEKAVAARLTRLVDGTAKLDAAPEDDD
jgi:hypothetical protein